MLKVYIAALERGDPIASVVIIGLQLLPGEAGFVEEGKVRTLRPIMLEPEPDVAEFGPVPIQTASILVKIPNRDIGRVRIACHTGSRLDRHK